MRSSDAMLATIVTSASLMKSVSHEACSWKCPPGKLADLAGSSKEVAENELLLCYHGSLSIVHTRPACPRRVSRDATKMEPSALASSAAVGRKSLEPCAAMPFMIYTTVSSCSHMHPRSRRADCVTASLLYSDDTQVSPSPL